MRLAASAGVGAMAAPGLRFALCIGSLQQRLPDFDWERKPGDDGSAGVAITPRASCGMTTVCLGNERM